MLSVNDNDKCCCKYKVNKRDETSKSQLISRVNRITGQLNGIKKMIEEDRYCDDVLIQLSAACNSIKSLANIILDEHIHTCVLQNIKEGNNEVLDELTSLFKRFQ